MKSISIFICFRNEDILEWRQNYIQVSLKIVGSQRKYSINRNLSFNCKLVISFLNSGKFQ